MGSSASAITKFLSYFTIIAVIFLFVFPIFHRLVFSCFKKVFHRCSIHKKKDSELIIEAPLIEQTPTNHI